jgi:hypothetical protein
MPAGYTGMQKAYLWMNFVLPLPSIVMYLFSPGGTVKHFGGEVTNSSKFWCSIAASGDAVIAYLMLMGILDKGRNKELFKLIVRSTTVYSLFHVGGFWYWHLYGDQHPQGSAMYPIGLAVAAAAFVAWGR